jgi:hypothetical protein
VFDKFLAVFCQGMTITMSRIPDTATANNKTSLKFKLL